MFDCYCKISWICGLPVETVCEGLPQLDVVPPFACSALITIKTRCLSGVFHIFNSGKLTFIIETIDAVDGGTLVVSSQQEKVLRVLKQIRVKPTHILFSNLGKGSITPVTEIVR